MSPKIIFWGTPEFAIPSLKALIQGGYKISAAVTNPDEPKGRKQTLTPPPVKVLAQKHKIPVFQPESLKIGNCPPEADPPLAEKLEIPEADLFVVAAFGKIIPKEILDIPKFGVLNIHPSLLPRWRGPSPIQYTILHGDAETGVTIIKMDELMDHGPIISASSFQLLASSKPTYRELHDKLAALGADLLIKTLPKYLKGEITPVPQDDSQATFSKILKKDDGRIDWKKPAEDLERMIRAFNPWPGTWTLAPGQEKILRLKIEEGEAVDEECPQGVPGFLWKPSSQKLMISTGRGSILVKSLTLEGKKSLDAASFIRGYANLLDTTLV